MSSTHYPELIGKMSTQIKIHIRSEEMHMEMLKSEGVIGGPLAQLVSNDDYFDDFTDLLSENDSVVVGSSLDEWPDEVANVFNGVERIDNLLMNQVEVILDEYEVEDDDRDRLIEFLSSHIGEEAFTVHW